MIDLILTTFIYLEKTRSDRERDGGRAFDGAGDEGEGGGDHSHGSGAGGHGDGGTVNKVT